jgi:hypothetical protein
MKTIKNEDYSRKHTKQRLKERYNIELSDDDYYKLCDLVGHEIGTKLITSEWQKDGAQTIYDVFFKNRKIRVVWFRGYNQSFGYIRTVLPK